MKLEDGEDSYSIWAIDSRFGITKEVECHTFGNVTIQWAKFDKVYRVELIISRLFLFSTQRYEFILER